ncbi:MAG: cytidine deaminase [bacterium]|nr:cytidine deaminase [bacterium]
MQWDKLIHAAQQVRKNAYAPYSQFNVGAALVTSSGKIYTGCNVENASFGLTICAERNAIAAAVANGEKKITAIAIVADTEELTPPCGACRQVIYEFGKNAAVMLANLKGKKKIFRITELLCEPFNFHKKTKR